MSPSFSYHHLFLALAVSGALFGVLILGNSSPQSQSAAAASTTQVILPPPEVEAQSAIVYDIMEQRVLFAKNDSTQMPLASLTKLFTVLVARETLDPEEFITIQGSDLSREGDSGLSPGSVWRAQDLIDYTLITSSNDGAETLRRVTEESPRFTQTSFTDALRVFVERLSLQQTFIVDPTGLDESAELASSYGSAHDMATLMTYIYFNAQDVVSGTTKEYISIPGKKSLMKNTNEALDVIPGLIAGKTGYTDLAGGNLAVLADLGMDHPVAIVVLQSSRDGRFSDVRTLLEYARKIVESK